VTGTVLILLDKIISSTNNVLTRFEAIERGIRTVTEQEDNIRSAMEEQGEGSKLVLQAISEVNEMASGTEKINVTVNQVNDISRNNRENIDILVGEVSRFKVD
jgi:methyl-accepting chemotaxis protein